MPRTRTPDKKGQADPKGFFINLSPRTTLRPVLLGRAIDHTAGSEIWGWFPGFDFPGRFGKTWAIALRCYRTSDGTRVFLPHWDDQGKSDHEKRKRAGWAEFVRIAGAVGVEVRETRMTADGPRKPTAASRADAHRHAVMLTLHEYARRTRLYLSGHFGSIKDLVMTVERVKVGGRSVAVRVPVFPEGLGPGGGRSTGRGTTWHGWTADELIAAGRNALPANEAAGRPIRGQCIAAGFHAAAQLAPWGLPGSVAARSGRIRAALFAVPETGPTVVPPQKVIDAVYGEAERYYCGHATGKPDESAEAFLEYHSGRHSNFRGQIKAKGLAEARLGEEEIDRALAELCWWSVGYAGSAVSAVMRVWLAKARAAAAVVGSPLTAREAELFSLMYISVPETNGLPLAVLFERLDLLEPWLADVVGRPITPHDWAVFHTLLGYHASTAEVRRRADRQRKRQGAGAGRTPDRDPVPRASPERGGAARKAKTERRAGPRIEPLPPELGDWRRGAAEREAESREQVEAIAERVRARFAIRCGCRAPRWSPGWAHEGDSVTFTFRCGRCGAARKKTLTTHQLAEMNSDLRETA
jgi:hypothetical protein